MTGVLVAVVAYVGAQLAIGFWVSRRVATETDYILAGRTLGPVLGAFSVYATWFGVETVLGASGRIYAEGLSGAQGEPFAYAAGIILMGAIFAVPLWRRGLVTFGDYFRQRFSPGVERLAVLLLVPGSILWVAAQLRGFGHIMSDLAGFDLGGAMLLGVVVVVLYTMLGGMLADAYSDLVQGIVIVVGLLAIFVTVALVAGGPVTALAKIAPERLAWFGAEQSWYVFAEQWAIPICGSLVAIELISRILACRSPEVARQAALGGGVLYLGVALIPVFLGLIGPDLLPACGKASAAPLPPNCIAEPEKVSLALAVAFLPPVFYVMFVGALVAAIISTIDSTLLACSSMIAHNLVPPLRLGLSEAQRLMLVRAAVALLGLVAFAIALSSDGISALVETASAFASAGVFVALVFGLFSGLGGPGSAYAALIAGAGVWALGKYGLGWSVPYLAGLAAAAIAYVGVAIAEGVVPGRR